VRKQISHGKLAFSLREGKWHMRKQSFPDLGRKISHEKNKIARAKRFVSRGQFDINCKDL